MFGVSQVDLIQVVLIGSNRSRVAFLLDSGCVTHPVQNYFHNSCLTNLVMMFAMVGIAFTKMLPEDKNYKFDLTPLKIPLKIPNRWALAVGNSIFCVFVEVILNDAGALLWVYDFWKASLLGVIPVIIFGHLHFMVVPFWVYDMKERKNQILTLAVIYTVDILAIVLFVGILGFI
ncbi:MAG: hypothetical protein ACW98G_09790 [Candidatus Hodarchaeales archaeon]|jgi:hypothetical protein